jgi:hypothetical protein
MKLTKNITIGELALSFTLRLMEPGSISMVTQTRRTHDTGKLKFSLYDQKIRVWHAANAERITDPILFFLT